MSVYWSCSDSMKYAVIDRCEERNFTQISIFSILSTFGGMSQMEFPRLGQICITLKLIDTFIEPDIICEFQFENLQMFTIKTKILC